MEGDRIARAVARIEAAAGRIEAAAGKRAGDPQLEARYEALRGEAAAAIAQIDQLLAALDT